MTERRGVSAGIPEDAGAGAATDVLDPEDQAREDEKDLGTLRRWFGYRYSITYDAALPAGHPERWDARPKYNVGRPGEKITAGDPGALADRICAQGGITYLRITDGERVIGVLRRTANAGGEEAHLFAGNLSWGPATPGMFDDGPEKAEEITAAEAEEITARLLRAAAAEQ